MLFSPIPDSDQYTIVTCSRSPIPTATSPIPTHYHRVPDFDQHAIPCFQFHTFQARLPTLALSSTPFPIPRTPCTFQSPIPRTTYTIPDTRNSDTPITSRPNPTHSTPSSIFRATFPTHPATTHHSHLPRSYELRFRLIHHPYSTLYSDLSDFHARPRTVYTTSDSHISFPILPFPIYTFRFRSPRSVPDFHALRSYFFDYQLTRFRFRRTSNST